MAIEYAKAAAPKQSPSRVTPVTVTQPKVQPVKRNNATVTAGDRIADLEARVARLEALLSVQRQPAPSRAEYMRAYRQRKKES
jgi:hypothetical protein